MRNWPEIEKCIRNCNTTDVPSRAKHKIFFSIVLIHDLAIKFLSLAHIFNNEIHNSICFLIVDFILYLFLFPNMSDRFIKRCPLFLNDLQLYQISVHRNRRVNTVRCRSSSFSYMESVNICSWEATSTASILNLAKAKKVESKNAANVLFGSVVFYFMFRMHTHSSWSKVTCICGEYINVKLHCQTSDKFMQTACMYKVPQKTTKIGYGIFGRTENEQFIGRVLPLSVTF